jgi:hypothetical protein
MDKDGRKVSFMQFGAREIGITGMESVVLFSPDSDNGEVNRDCAMGFLDVLIERARAGLDNMTDQEAAGWLKDFMDKNLPDEEEEESE